MEGRERGSGGGERETQRGASITPLNLPVTARAWMEGGVCEGRRRVGFTLTDGQRFISFLYPEFVSSLFGELGLQGLDSLKVLITPIDFPEIIGFC